MTALNQKQLANARVIYQLARARGLPDARAQELVWAANRESGLRNEATNRSSGAAGLFQLLSPGYVNRANQLGGVRSPRANTLSILPDYLAFFKQHPNAAPGEAAAAVERSGQGASFYRPLGSISGLGGQALPVGGAPQAPVSATGIAAGGLDRRQLALDLIASLEARRGRPGWSLLQTLHATDQPVSGPQAQPAAVTKTGSYPIQRVGKLVFPVAGGAKFSNDWGAPRADTGSHQGNDLFAAQGTPVVAVENGVITKMGPSAIGGNRVWLNGKWYYAHLDRFAGGIRPGVRVKAGQVLGYVGTTGDARGTPPHLHFGYDPSGGQGSHWANPYPLLGGR